MDEETQVVKKTTTESTETGPAKDAESKIGNISVRGWIAIISVVALALALIIALIGVIIGKLPVDASSISIIVTITGLLSNLAATYIGQGAKPKS